ncbi:lactate utilization protein C [Halobacteriales archaeon QS_3_64_16]|nr:MAG: lactate utilization protein C [Halobacteriales archaeon QS_3_64_16]
MSLEVSPDTEAIAAFESTLEKRDLAASVTITSAAEFSDALSDLLDPPVVAAALPFEGISYEDVDNEITLSPDPADLDAARTGITAAGLGVADYGTVTIRSTPGGEEFVSLYPERHVVVVAASDIVPDMPTAFDRLAEEFEAGHTSQILATGPSATGDMGGIVKGVHGPQEVHIIVLEDC